MRTRQALLLLLAALPVPALAQGNDAVQRQLLAAISGPARVLSDSGFAVVQGVAMTGTLQARTYADGTMRLEAGRQYVIVGVCSDGCSDIDLTVTDPAGEEVGADTESDALPVIVLQPTQTGDYIFRVQMYECTTSECAYFVQPFVRGGAGALPSVGRLAGRAPGRAPAGPMAGADRVERGTLASGDQTLAEGEYMDVYSFEGTAGQRVVLDLTSSDFDTYLFVRGPNEFGEDNDDYQGSTSRSHLEVTLPVTGTYRVAVTSYSAGETGSYELRISAGASAPDGNKEGEQPDDVRTERGRLEAGDPTLAEGEYYDTYYFDGRAGQRVAIDLTSGDFDTYVFVRGPGQSDALNEDNDDYDGNTRRSHIDATLPADGRYRIIVTSYRGGETGSYVLTITTTAGTGGGASLPSAPEGTRVERGTLASGDQTLSTGEFVDGYSVQGRRGQEIVLDLQSRDFDPYLLLRGPADLSEDNDDFEGSRSRSVIRATLPADGEYTVGVTSYAAGESGAYELRITLGGDEGGQVAQGAGLRERGSLSGGDATLRSGEFADEFSFSGTVGQRVIVDLRSSEFDPYLILISPTDDQEENDDWEGSTSHARLETTLGASGTYRVLVTSYAVGETGSYDLSVEFGGAVATSGQRDVQRLAAGATERGRLEAGDGQLEGGEYRDLWVFEGTAGQEVTLDMRSGAFDTYLALVLPNDETVQNDDFEGSTSHSQITMALPASGRYRIVATSYASGETGDYELTLRLGTAPVVASGPAARPPVRPSASGPRLFGVFAGISDYGGRANDLPYTAEDAVRIYNAMQAGPRMPAEHGVLLTDRQATAGNIRAAIERFARQMGPDDMLVFFYSGHGGREPRSGPFQGTDPDNLDETLVFADRDVTDDEFAEWLDMVTNGRVLLVLDACFSGGFAKDVISRPNRMGLFSSEEDVTSSVAAKFRAGGYLSVFLADAIENKLADADRDGMISALELSQYVHDRYRLDVKSDGDPGDYVRTGGPQLGYQHLVVDRGSVGPYDVLFR